MMTQFDDRIVINMAIPFSYPMTAMPNCSQCQAEFIPNPRNRRRTPQKYCSHRCQGLAASRRPEARKRRSDAWQRGSNFINTYKQSHPCVNCGESDPVCLDFHHRDPKTKRFGIGRGGCARSIFLLKEEIAKCLVLCANCHRKHHAIENVTT